MENEEMLAPAVGEQELKKFMKILHTYRAGKANTDRRIIASENWWKLRNTQEEQKQTQIGADGGFTSRSGWLHNVIVSKHADAMESFPAPNFLPREEADREEADRLKAIVPCILEHNHFEKTYSDAMWQKMKTGTAAYKIVWDRQLHNGLGDIRVERVNLLNLYWQPGITDIQRSRFLFQTEMVEKEVLKQRYPQLEQKLRSTGPFSSRFLYDDPVPESDYATVIEVYYRLYREGRQVLHYCKFVGDQVLFATENELIPGLTPEGRVLPPLSETGLYDHGQYPYVLDPLFPIEGSPCGYGFVDLCRNPQTEIDLMKTSFVKNAMVGAVPRYFSQENGNVRPEDFLDLSKPLVNVSGNLDETSLRRIEHISLDGNYLNLLQQDINELRETSGNTEASTGNINSGVTAASAIAALQEASGKGSRDSTRSSYRAFAQIAELCVELIRQFYCLPRQFRITGAQGQHSYIRYTNAGLQPQQQEFLGRPMGLRKPVFDIRISAQRKNVFSTVSQNELALQLFRLGFFDPRMADQAVMCLDMMEFDGKDSLIRQIGENGRRFGMLQRYLQTAGPAPQQDGQMLKLSQADSITGTVKKEPARVTKARQRATNAVLPDGGKA